MAGCRTHSQTLLPSAWASSSFSVAFSAEYATSGESAQRIATTAAGTTTRPTKATATCMAWSMTNSRRVWLLFTADAMPLSCDGDVALPSSRASPAYLTPLTVFCIPSTLKAIMQSVGFQRPRSAESTNARTRAKQVAAPIRRPAVVYPLWISSVEIGAALRWFRSLHSVATRSNVKRMSRLITSSRSAAKGAITTKNRSHETEKVAILSMTRATMPYRRGSRRLMAIVLSVSSSHNVHAKYVAHTKSSMNPSPSAAILKLDVKSRGLPYMVSRALRATHRLTENHESTNT
jgi:hypothetical protein